MDFTPASQNGITPPSEIKTLQSKFGLAVNTTSTVYGNELILKAISDAAMYKTEPVTFYRRANSTATSTAIGTGTWISTNSCVLVTTTLGTGTYQLYATWPGEGMYAPQSTEVVPIQYEVLPGFPVGGTFSHTATPSSGNVVVGEGSVTFTVTASTSVPLNDTLSFYVDNVFYGQAPFINNVATLTIPNLPAGNLTISTKWPGGIIGGVLYEGFTYDISYTVAAGTNIGNSMTLSLSLTTIIVNEDSFSLTSTINTSTQINTGSIYFYANGVELAIDDTVVSNQGSVTLAGSGNTGTFALTSVYDGNPTSHPRYLPITSNTATLTVLERDTATLTLVRGLNPTLYNKEPITLTATLNTSKAPGGTVTFYENGVSLGAAPLVNNVATLSVSGLSTGTHNILATYSGTGLPPKFFSTTSNVVSATVVSALVYPATGTVTLVGSDPVTGYAYAFAENKLVYSLSTSTTGTNVTGYVKFYQSNTSTSNFIGSATFVSKSATLPFIPAKTMNLNTGSSFHNFIAITQDLTIDGIRYYSTTSSKTGTILPYVLSIGLSTSTITVADPVLVTNNWGIEVNTSTGQLEILDGTNVITTTTMDLNQVISLVQLPAGTFTAGAHTVKNSYKGAKTPITSSTSLTVNARGTYPGTLTLSGLSSTYQLDHQTYTLTSDYNTSTTGAVYLQQVSGTTVVNIATGTFNSNSINFNVPFDRFFVDASQEVRVYWEGQDWTPNVYYPYNAKYSNTLAQTVTLANVAFAPSTSTVPGTSPFQVIGTVNTSSSLATTANITFQAKKNIITYSTITVTSTNLSVVTQQSSTTTYNMATTGTVGHRYFYSVYVNSQPSYTRRWTATNVLSTTSWIDGVDYGVTLGDNVAYQAWPVTSSTFGTTFDNNSYWIKVNDIKNITTGSVVLVDAFIKYSKSVNGDAFKLGWSFSPFNEFYENSEILCTNGKYQVMKIFSTGIDEHYLWVKNGYSTNPWYKFPDGFPIEAVPPYNSTFKYWYVEGTSNANSTDILKVYLYANSATNPYIRVRLAGTQYGAYQPQVAYINSLTATLGTSSVVVNTATVAVSSGTLSEFTGTWILDGYMNIGTLTVPSTTGTVIIT